MRLVQHLTALRAWCGQCLPDRCKPDVLRPGIVGMRDYWVIRLRPCMISSTPFPVLLTVILGRSMAVRPPPLPPSRKHIASFDAVIDIRESTHNVPQSASLADLSRMQLNLHGTHRMSHGASRLVQSIFSWSLKARFAPSQHRQDTRVYTRTTTAMHGTSTPPPSLSSICLTLSSTRKKSRPCKLFCEGYSSP